MVNKDEFEDFEPAVNNIEYKKFRPGALILEFGPMFIALISGLLGVDAIYLMSMLLLSLIYTFGGWYIFKAEKYNVFDIIWATIAGMCISILINGILFYSMSWEGADLMLISCMTTLIFGLFGSILLLALKLNLVDNKAYQFTFSQKIFSRFAALAVIYLAFGMSRSFFELF